MTPYLTAHAAYHAEPTDLPWNDMLSAHFHNPHAWVISTPTLFVAARLTSSKWEAESVIDPNNYYRLGDTLHIYIVAGKLTELLTLIPPHLLPQLKYITSQRPGQYSIHPTPLHPLLKRILRTPPYLAP